MDELWFNVFFLAFGFVAVLSLPSWWSFCLLNRASCHALTMDSWHLDLKQARRVDGASARFESAAKNKCQCFFISWCFLISAFHEYFTRNNSIDIVECWKYDRYLTSYIVFISMFDVINPQLSIHPDASSCITPTFTLSQLVNYSCSWCLCRIPPSWH